MVVNGWKITAIVFICLFVAETVFVFYIANLGVEAYDNKLKCSNEVCFEIKAESFTYDEYTKTCSCYNEEEVIKTKVMP